MTIIVRIDVSSVAAGQVSLCAFMVSVWNYCIHSKDRLPLLAFDIYDRDTSGGIGEADVEGILTYVWGAKWWAIGIPSATTH